MPRGQKSKLRAREKRRQVQVKAESHQDAQATAAEEKESPTPPSPDSGGSPSSLPTLRDSQGPQEEQPTTSAAACAPCKTSEVDDKSQDESQPSTSNDLAINVNVNTDLISRRAGMLLQLMLFKFKIKEPITKADMLKIVNKRSRDQFSEIFKLATDRLELIFGISLKKIKPTGHSYTFVSTDSTDDSVSSDEKIIKNGLVMPLLGVIFLNGNRASEEEMWEFLSVLGIEDGKKFLDIDDPRKLITKDLVKQNYLECHQIPNSNPPHYEFMWGARACAETSKMQVLEFLAKINHTVPAAFGVHYQEALKEEEERAQAKAAKYARKKKPEAKPVDNLVPDKE
ncbi:melanoma-associated antigen B4-like [Suncus etruscus]|uniref:melanoma-associated antigen B4-like n=1 Tax=Suncus etruscus TaxID=109475 RepID=UPI002110AED3|nr:melanoma-associated antigen B4-like [Suncus etruscus]